jgi:hypothetical protein
MLRQIVLCLLIAFPPATRVMGESHHHGLDAIFDLRRSCCGWEVGFADYREGEASFYELAWACADECSDLNRGLSISGSNHSDDLFMFIKRPICGLKPCTTYQVEADIEFLSRAPTGCVGIGGDPGESVYVKFGASPEEPSTVIEDGMARMNVDIGYQANGGTNAIVIGNIATSITDCHNEQYEAKRLATPAPLVVQTDTTGTLWIFVGTDSAFEGITSLIYTEVCIRIQKHKDK